MWVRGQKMRNLVNLDRSGCVWIANPGNYYEDDGSCRVIDKYQIHCETTSKDGVTIAEYDTEGDAMVALDLLIAEIGKWGDCKDRVYRIR